MDDKITRLASRLKETQIAQAEIDELVRAARDEAFTEARAILKDILVEAILERALSMVAGGERLEAPAEPERQSTVQQPTSVPPPPVSASEGKEELLQEIEAIRKKIAENERSLSGMQVPPQPAKRQAPRSSNGDTPHTERDQGNGYYVYCIVKDDGSRQALDWPAQGIDPAHPVYALPDQGIQAVVSEVSLSEFGLAELEANLNDLQWLESKVRAHQAILEAVLAGGTCVPMRLCTIYRTEQRVRELMAQHYDDFVSALDRLQGKHEWGVKVYCDGQMLASKVSEVSERVKALAAQTKTKSGGSAYFLKKKLGEATAEEVERISNEYAQHSHDLLSSHADAATLNSLQSKEITHRKDEMLLNAAYLVAESQLAAFRAELDNLSNEYGAQGFSFEMTGPWPSYNFATIDLEHEAMDEPVGG
jgi:hypothetical protein